MQNNEDVEKSTISIMMNYPNEDFSQLSTEDFYNHKYKIIVEGIIEMKKENIPIDMITLYEKVKWRGVTTIDITSFSEGNSSVASLPQYISLLKWYRRKREQHKLATEMTELSDGSPTSLLHYADKLKELSLIGEMRDDTVKMDDVNLAYEQIMERMGKTIYGYSWGSQFSFLDNMTKWLLKKKIYRVGAPSGKGKTQFIYNVIPELLKQKNPDGSDVKVAFFTLENTKEDTLTAIMCKANRINQFKLNKWEVEGNWQYLVDLKDRLFVIDNLYDLDDIFVKIAQIKPDVIVLDYISYVTIKKCTEEAKYSEYARKVVPFAKSQDIVWIDLSNLANDTQTNEEIRFKPKFYWSSILVNNSDVNIMIMQNENFKKTKDNVIKDRVKYWKEAQDYFMTRNMIDMVITKNRWWPPWYETLYGINQDNGGIYQELSLDELDKLWAKYW